ncbi:MAG: transporter substrate-binding domain-containing protein [Chloroflexi bacterium]|nr:transporter substrate-binding domain-containing protein [Chloroflexota bacterium]
MIALRQRPQSVRDPPVTCYNVPSDSTDGRDERAGMEEQMHRYRKLAVLPVAMLILAACQSNTGSSVPASAGGAQTACATASGDDLLKTICDAGVIKISTDPNYAPQSFLKPDGSYEGFDIDVANEIGKRLGVTVQFETPEWEAITAGSWSGRWDISVGSMTITTDRKAVLDFSKAYYYTPAQMASNVDSIKAVADFAGKTVCAGESTTYVDWLNGNLSLVDAPTPVDPPAGVTVTTLPTDANCAEAWQAGRDDFQGWISSSTTVAQAMGEGITMHLVGDPVFYEPLAVAIDKGGPAHAQLLAAIDDIIQAMHDDGTLTEFSKHWYDGQDLTVLASNG